MIIPGDGLVDGSVSFLVRLIEVRSFWKIFFENVNVGRLK